MNAGKTLLLDATERTESMEPLHPGSGNVPVIGVGTWSRSRARRQNERRAAWTSVFTQRSGGKAAAIPMTNPKGSFQRSRASVALGHKETKTWRNRRILKPRSVTSVSSMFFSYFFGVTIVSPFNALNCMNTLDVSDASEVSFAT